MSWSATAGMAVTACLVVPACFQQPPCNPPPCPTATIDMHALDDSTFDWGYRDFQLMAQSTGFVPAPPTGYDCSFSFTPGLVRPLDASFDPGSITLTCSGALYGVFDIKLTSLGDMRDWPAGTFTLVPPAGTVSIVGFFGAAPPVAGLAVTVTVEAAVGGSAPYPQLVTSDYVRTFRLDFDTASLAPKDENGRPDVTMTAKVSLHLSQTAAEYVADPTAFCGCV